MSRIGLFLLFAIALTGVGCGYGSHNYMNGNGNGMLQIKQLSPTSTAAGGSAFSLTITGTGFGTDSVVYWGTTTRTTTYDSATQVTVEISATDIMNAGMVQVYVHSGGTNSNSMAFTIQ